MNERHRRNENSTEGSETGSSFHCLGHQAVRPRSGTLCTERIWDVGFAFELFLLMKKVQPLT